MFSDSPLRFATCQTWTDTVMQSFDTFLQDHAAAEKKASGMALSMISHYPDKPALVEAMSALAIEELSHFREVISWLHRRGVQLGADTKDPYINALRKQIRQGREVYFLDRLITASIIEARGCERFALVAEALPAGKLKDFYSSIARSEQKHYKLFLELARQYFSAETVEQRWDELLDIEARLVAELPPRAALH